MFSARNATKTRELAGLLEAKGYKADGRTVDVADPESVASLIAGVERDFGSVDVLHYNVASMRTANISTQDPSTFIPDLAINIGGALIATQAVLKKMSERRSGTILLTGGGYAVAPNPERLSLSIGKAGIRSLTLALFEGLKAQGVHIGTIAVLSGVAAGSKEVEAIGDHFWKLHNQPTGSWTAEIKSPA